MPIPTPSNETQREFISKCTSAISDEYDSEQALAICYDSWREENFKGISLVLGKVNLKEPCWSGYEQYGTKIVNGREVPNCIPQD